MEYIIHNEYIINTSENCCEDGIPIPLVYTSNRMQNPKIELIGFEVLTALVMDVAIFWYVTPRNPLHAGSLLG
jgi:hypothetical protein